MTYCVALKLNEGIVMLSDTRTNAGVDNIAKVSKLFTWNVPNDRAIAIMTAGNLAITQAIISELEDALNRQSPQHPTLYSAKTMFEVAQVVGDCMNRVQARYGPGLIAQGVDAGATLIVAGQRAGGKPRMFMVYSAGNFIEATVDSPYFQIGEHKYGKPILDRVISMQTELRDGIIAVLLSMDSTIRSNLTVGMPLDLCVMRTNSIAFEQLRRIEAEDPQFHKFSEAWSNVMRDAFGTMRKMDV